MMSLKIEICKEKEGSEPQCTKITVRKGLPLILACLMIAVVVVNFFMGLALGQPLEYIALSIVMCLIVIACMIPILGLVILIGYFMPWTATVISDLAILPSFWLDAVVVIAWWIAIIVQIVILVYIIYKIVTYVIKLHEGKMK
jgi:hypothetical protein